MSFQVVKWSSNKKLPCGGCTTANVFLRISSALIAQRACVGTVDPSQLVDPDTAYSWKFIAAQIVGFQPLRGGCNTALYQYTFSYDDTQLLSGTTLAASDISSVICEGAFTDFAKEQAGNEVYIDYDEFNEGRLAPTLVTQHGCKYTLPHIASVDGTIYDDGISFAAQPDGHIETIDVVLTNPTDKRNIDFNINIAYSLQLEGSNSYAAGITGTVLVDGVQVGNAITSYFRANNQDIIFVAGAPSLTVLLTPGETKTLTLQLELNLGTEPNNALAVRHISINYESIEMFA